MKKMIAFVCALALMLSPLPTLAEDAMPTEVQTFFTAMSDALNPDEVMYAESHEAYVQGMPGILLSFTISRQQYNRFYYYTWNTNNALTVCCIDDKPMAYIFDCNVVEFIGYSDVMDKVLNNFPDAYCKANPQQESSIDGFGFFTDAMLQSIYDPMSRAFVSDLQDHGQTLISSHVFSRSGQTAIQLFPKAAYDGVTVNGEVLTAEINHALSAALALDTEYQLMIKSLE